jgi:hypothetical protein
MGAEGVGLTAWAMSAQPGAVREYFRGYLPNWPGKGDEAQDLFQAGYVTLVQKRIQNFEYVYICIAKKDKERPFDPTEREDFWGFAVRE